MQELQKIFIGFTIVEYQNGKTKKIEKKETHMITQASDGSYEVSAANKLSVRIS